MADFGSELIYNLTTQAISGFSTEQILAISDPMAMTLVFTNSPSNVLEDFSEENNASLPTMAPSFSAEQWENLPADAMSGLSALNFQAFSAQVSSQLGQVLQQCLALQACLDCLMRWQIFL